MDDERQRADYGIRGAAMNIVRKTPGEFRVGDIVVDYPSKLAQVIETEIGLMLHVHESNRPDQPVVNLMKSMAKKKFLVIEEGAVSQ